MSIDKISKIPHPISVRQVKAARALLGWSQAELARHSGISEPTIARLEAEDGELGGRASTATKIFEALTKAGIEFIEDNGDGTGVRLSSAPKLEFSSAQCRGARAMLGWSLRKLAKLSAVDRQAIDDFEREASPLPPNQLTKLKRTLESAGIMISPCERGAIVVGRSTPQRLTAHGYDNSTVISIRQSHSLQSYDISAAQSKMARVALAWGVRDLAKNAGVSPDTVARLERGEQLKSSTVEAIRAAFEAAGIEFIPENGGGPGVRAPKRKD